MLPTNDVPRINYYTARVGARIDDPAQPIRQQTYLRALGTLHQAKCSCVFTIWPFTLFAQFVPFGTVWTSLFDRHGRNSSSAI